MLFWRIFAHVATVVTAAKTAAVATKEGGQTSIRSGADRLTVCRDAQQHTYSASNGSNTADCSITGCKFASCACISVLDVVLKRQKWFIYPAVLNFAATGNASQKPLSVPQIIVAILYEHRHTSDALAANAPYGDWYQYPSVN